MAGDRATGDRRDLQRRYAAIAGLSAEHMGRTAAWRFHDLGRRIERAMAMARAIRLFGMPGASPDDLSVLLDLADSQITYRQRYPTGIAASPSSTSSRSIRAIRAASPSPPNASPRASPSCRC